MNRQLGYLKTSQFLLPLAFMLALGFPVLSLDLVRYAQAEEEHEDEHGHEEEGHVSEGEKKKHEHGEADGHEHAKEKSSKKEDEHAHEEGGHDDHGEGEEGGGHGDHEEEEGGTRFGPGKAITAANKKDGIQLSEKATKTLGLSHITATGTGTFKLPFKSAVFFQNEVGIYRLKNGWHKLIEVELISKTTTEVVVKSSELKSGDQVAKDGVPLLRAAELEAWGGSGDGHGH